MVWNPFFFFLTILNGFKSHWGHEIYLLNSYHTALNMTYKVHCLFLFFK